MIVFSALGIMVVHLLIQTRFHYLPESVAVVIVGNHLFLFCDFCFHCFSYKKWVYLRAGRLTFSNSLISQILLMSGSSGVRKARLGEKDDDDPMHSPLICRGLPLLCQNPHFTFASSLIYLYLIDERQLDASITTLSQDSHPSEYHALLNFSVVMGAGMTTLRGPRQ